MASPFAVFRRHQRLLTIILTVLAMFAFILLDQLQNLDGTRVMPFLFAGMGAGVFWIWGEGKNGKADNSQILTGAVIGAVIGALPLLTKPADRGIPTSIGTISEQELFELRQDRELANSFVRQAFNERENAFGFLLQQYIFGGASTQEIVARQLLLHEADRLGISIGNEYITDFIKEVSDSRLTQKEFRKIRSQLGMGEVQLFDLLREELRAQAAYRVINPVVVHMPEQYWQDYRKVNVRQSVDVTAIPVEAFADGVEAPTEAALKTLFEEFREVYPNGDKPGFLQPDRRAIAWLEPDMKKFEAEVGEISEDDLRARYEERKEAFYKKSPKLPDIDLPEFGSTDEPESDTPEAPEPGTTPPADGDDTTPESETPSAPESDKPADTTPEPAVPETPAKPADDSETPAKPADESESSAPDAESENEGVFSVNDEQEDTAAETEGEPDAQPEPETPVEPEKPAAGDTPEAPASADGEDEPAETPASSDDKPASESDDAPEETPATPEGENAEDSDKPAETEEIESDTPEVEYEAFEDVREELLQLVRDERVRALVDAKVKEAVDTINRSRKKLDTEIRGEADDTEVTVEDTAQLEAREKARKEKLAKRLAEAISTWATENGFFFREAAPLSQQELLDHEDYGETIAAARDPFDPESFSRNQFQMPQRQTVAQRLFSASSPLLVPNTSEGMTSVPTGDESASESDEKSDALESRATTYVWWSTQEVEAHVATFDEPGVREQVEKAFRLREAQPTAKERAETVAALITKELAEETEDVSIPKTMTEAVAAQTVTGDTDGLQLTVLTSPPFSWLQRSFSGMQSNPFAQPQVEFGRIPGVDGAGNDFMQAVYEMQPGDVKAIANFDRSVYYIVHLKARTPSEVNWEEPMNWDGTDTLPQRFLKEQAPVSPLFGGLARSQASETHQQWMTEFLKRYNVDPQLLGSI